MPSMSFGLHPSILQGLASTATGRLPGGTLQPGMQPLSAPTLFDVTRNDPRLSRPAPVSTGPWLGSDPTLLKTLRPGAPQPSSGPVNPFQGGTNPGAYGTPAPFNPLLAQTLLGQRGGLPGFGGNSPLAHAPGQQAPLGSFGQTPLTKRPRGSNPYQPR